MEYHKRITASNLVQTVSVLCYGMHKRPHRLQYSLAFQAAGEPNSSRIVDVSQLSRVVGYLPTALMCLHADISPLKEHLRYTIHN
jgi:hypothetical protein